MKSYYSDDSQKDLAIFFYVLKASGFTNRETRRFLCVPWITLYKWGRKHLNLSGFDSNPKIRKLLNEAGNAIAKARTLPTRRRPRRKGRPTEQEKLQIAELRKLAVEAFLAVRKRGHSSKDASRMVGKSESTIKRWKELYDQGGIESLMPGK